MKYEKRVDQYIDKGKNIKNGELQHVCGLCMMLINVPLTALSTGPCRLLF